jgi:UDP-glucose 4-epimerase
MDNLNTGKMSKLDDVGDEKNSSSLFKATFATCKTVKEAVKGQDALFHEAAFVSVTNPRRPLVWQTQSTLKAPLHVEGFSGCRCKRFVFASSRCCLRRRISAKKRRKHELEPSNPYVITKLAGESYVRAFWKVYKLPTVALRYFNVYGPKQSFDLDCAYGGAVTIFINRIIRGLPPVIYGDGEQTRDFVYVQDIVEANMLALTTEEATGQAFNIGKGSQVSVNQVAAALKQAVGKADLKNIYEPARVGEVKHGFADVSKAQKILKFKAKFGFQDGIQNLVDWYKQTQ